MFGSVATMLDLTSKETGMIDCRKVITYIFITQFKCRGYLYMSILFIKVIFSIKTGYVVLMHVQCVK